MEEKTLEKEIATVFTAKATEVETKFRSVSSEDVEHELFRTQDELSSWRSTKKYSALSNSMSFFPCLK